MNIEERIKQILTAEASAILSVKVTASFEAAVCALHDARGKVLTTGMGKAGHVARKFASTLYSTGTPAAYIHPGESAHGDLGLVGSEDLIVAFSTSGKTREVLEMLELARQIGIATIIGITSHPDSPLREASDIVVDMGIITEPCSHGLTPTASTTVMLAISDAIALTLMEIKGVTREEWALRHHGGYLGHKSRSERN